MTWKTTAPPDDGWTRTNYPQDIPRITQDGNRRITEQGDVRVVEQFVPSLWTPITPTQE